jgi:hypothetical protein
MLDAFITKNVRRVLGTSKEHTSDKNEDAITSMVFTPLRFMAPGEALKCLRAVVPSIAEVALARGSPIDQNVTLWPPGLKARGWGGPGQTRVEPDLVAEFTFPTSGSRTAKLVIVGEMKWDWDIDAVRLRKELNRERNALKASGTTLFVFAVVKRQRSTPQELGCDDVLTWVDCHRNLEGFLRREAGDEASLRWARLVVRFLTLAERSTFTGFKNDYGVRGYEGPIFYQG